MQQRPLLTAAIAICASLLNACDDAARPPAPVSVSQAVAGGEERFVTMMDGCDPESFGAADVTCVRPGGVSFDRFLDLLGKHQSVGAWHSSPETLTRSFSRRAGLMGTLTEIHLK